MASIKTAFGSPSTFTVTLASLASSATAGRESTVIDNTSDLFLDALVMIKVKTGAGSAANDQAVYVYCYGTVDGGTTYPDTVTGSDAAITMNNPTQLSLLGAIWTPAASTTYKSQVFSVAKALGGFLPAKWGIVVRNYEGNALDSTEGNHAKLWQGLYSTVA